MGAQDTVCWLLFFAQLSQFGRKLPTGPWADAIRALPPHYTTPNIDGWSWSTGGESSSADQEDHIKGVIWRHNNTNRQLHPYGAAIRPDIWVCCSVPLVRVWTPLRPMWKRYFRGAQKLKQSCGLIEFVS